MINTQVSFMPLEDDSNVQPVFLKGKRDSIWVRTLSADQAEIAEAAKRKVRECYGIEVSDVIVCDGCQFSS